MSMEPCKDCGGKFCMCEACQSMKKMIREFEKRSTEEIFSGISGEAILKDQKEVNEQEE